MDLSVQTMQGPPPLQPPQPLSFLPPGAIPMPDSGANDYAQGVNTGSVLAKPLDEGIQQTGYWLSPEGQAAIAKAHLQTTQSNQYNQALLNTPGLPTLERVTQGEKLNSERAALPSATALEIGTNQGKIATVPAITNETIAGANAATQTGQNQLATTPKFYNYLSDEDVINRYPKFLAAQNEVLKNANIQQNDQNGNPIKNDGDIYTPPFNPNDPAQMALAKSQLQSSDNINAQRAGIDMATYQKNLAMDSNPIYSGGPNGAGIREGYYNDAGKLAQDKAVPQPGTIYDSSGNPQIVNGLKWEHGGLLSPGALQSLGYDPSVNDALRNGPLINARQGSMDASNSRQKNLINSRGTTYMADDGSGAIRFDQGTNQAVNSTISDFSKRQDVSGIVKIMPSILRANAIMESGTDAKTGITSLDAMLQAARIFRQSNVTDSEMRQMDQSGGLKQSLFQLVNAWDGKHYDADTMHDLQNAISTTAKSGNDYLEQIKSDFADSLPAAALPAANTLFKKVAHLNSNSRTQGNIQNSKSAAQYQTPQAHEQAIQWAKQNPNDPRAAALLQTANQSLNGQ